MSSKDTHADTDINKNCSSRFYEFSTLFVSLPCVIVMLFYFIHGLMGKYGKKTKTSKQTKKLTNVFKYHHNTVHLVKVIKKNFF